MNGLEDYEKPKIPALVIEFKTPKEKAIGNITMTVELALRGTGVVKVTLNLVTSYTVVTSALIEVVPLSIVAGKVGVKVAIP